MKNKGQVTIWISFLIGAIMLIIIAGLIAPIGVQINTKFYLAGQDILNDSLDDIEGIENAEVRATINQTVFDAQVTTQENISILSALFKYGWILVLVALIVVVFLLTRRIVEFGGGGLI